MAMFLCSGIFHEVLERQWGLCREAHHGGPLLWEDLAAGSGLLTPQSVPSSQEQGHLLLIHDAGFWAYYEVTNMANSGWKCTGENTFILQGILLPFYSSVPVPWPLIAQSISSLGKGRLMAAEHFSLKKKKINLNFLFGFWIVWHHFSHSPKAIHHCIPSRSTAGEAFQ